MSDDSDHFPRLDRERNVVDYFPAFVIRKFHVTKFYAALQRLFVNRVLRFGHVRLSIVNLEQTLHCICALGKEIRHIYEHEQRRVHHTDIRKEGEERSVGHLAVHCHPASHDPDDDRAHVHNDVCKREGDIVEYRNFFIHIGDSSGMPAEALSFFFLASEGLDDAHPGQNVRKRAAHGTEAGIVFRVKMPRTPEQPADDEQKQRNHDQTEQRKQGIHGEHYNENRNHLYDINQKIRQAVHKKPVYGCCVVVDLRHERSAVR